jgi:hypothetical protein
MTDHLRLHSDEPDDDVTRGLRQLFAPPNDDAYWRGLESRILARVQRSGPPAIAWWEELDGWTWPALVAAAVVLLAVSVGLLRDREIQQDTEYASVFTPTTLPVEAAVRPVLQEPREATLRYLIAP